MKKVFIYTISEGNENIRYVGKTINPKQRFKNHIYKSKILKDNNLKNKWIAELLKKNNNPKFEIIDIIDHHEWKFWEDFYINLFRSWGFDLLNVMRYKNLSAVWYKKLAPIKILQYNKEGNFIKQWKSISQASKILKINEGSIQSVIHNIDQYTAGGFLWRKKENDNFPLKIDAYKRTAVNKRKILQYDLDGNFIQEWDSLSLVKLTLKKISIPHISSACKNKKKHQTGGYMWRYKKSDDYPIKIDPIPEKNHIITPILQYDLDGNFIREWKSITDAEKKLNANQISSACSGIRKTANNFMWRYKKNDNYSIKIESLPNNIKNKLLGKLFQKRSILQYAKDGKLIKRWNSISEANKKTNINIGKICMVCRNQRKTAGGYIWKYVNYI